MKIFGIEYSVLPVRFIFLLTCFSLVIGNSSCKYSFTGIGIPADVRTFYVSPFEVTAANAEPILSQTFSDALRDKIQTESRLTQSETDPHCEFKGSITRYQVSSVAPQPGELTAFNRLDVTVNVDFINNKDETQSWKQSFSYFSDFSSDQNFLSIQDGLIETINNQLVEDIFNKAFTNW
jgi:lipopolysaccharide assembly LptE-like protein